MSEVIDLDKLEKAKNVSLDDTIYYVVQQSDNKDIKVVKINDLMPYFISLSQYSNLVKKYDELNALYKDFKKFIETNYPTQNMFSARYIKFSKFMEKYNNLKTIYTVLSDDLDNYCQKPYEEYLKTEVLLDMNEQNADLLEEAADSYVGLVDI